MDEKVARIQIHNFIEEIIDAFHDGELKDSDNIYDKGFVSSLGAMRLLQYIENTFEVQVPDEDIHLKNFNSVDSMVALVQKLKGDASNANDN